MAGLFASLLGLGARAAEVGLLGMDAALGAAQRAAALVSGRDGRAPAKPPLDGPADPEAAASELANRLARLAVAIANRRVAPAEAPRRAWDALAASLPRQDLSDPRRLLALPLEAPLAAGTLATQTALRALLVARALPPGRFGEFLGFAGELFSDLRIYFGLRYDDELARLRERARRSPSDARVRLELGRTLGKCGLLEEAIAELGAAIDLATSDGLRRRALYERLVARCRAGDAEGAVADGAACVALDPADERARFWLWLAAERRGGYPEAVREDLRMTRNAGRAPVGVELEEVAAVIGLDKTSGGRGTAILDVDGDGYLDVVIAGAHAGVSLYRNNGDGTFTDASTGSGLDRCVYAFAIAAGDYDNDGRTDLFTTALGFFDGRGSLWHNEGDGTFRDVTKDAGIDCWGPAFAAAWADYDGDGRLDLFVANNAGGLFDRKTPNRLFQNQGDGTFREVAAEAGITGRWPSLGCCWGDFRNVGRPDLFVSNFGRAQLFRNEGDGTFTEVGRAAGIDEPAIGSVALCCDVDDDGWLDVVQLTYSRPADAIHTLRHGRGPADGQPMRVFKNNRDGTFTRIDRELGLDGCWGTMSAAVGDVDNDGFLDLLLGNGDPQMDRTEGPVLLRRDGSRFRDVTLAAGLPPAGKGHGANLADLAGDGRLHLIVGSGGLYPGDLLTTAVFRPKRRPGNYLNVRLAGAERNRDAIGARLVLRAAGREQHRVISGGTNFGCLPFEQHFGLGKGKAIERLEITWPNGKRQTLDSPPVNTTIRIVEGEGGWAAVYGRKAKR